MGDLPSIFVGLLPDGAQGSAQAPGETVVRTTLRKRTSRAVLVFAASSLLGVTALATAGAPAVAATASSNELGCIAATHGSSHVGRIAGISHAVKTACPAPHVGDAANGTPPLLYHGGPMMMTRSTGALVVTPIFWTPSGHPMDAAYKSILTGYISDVAAASGSRTNVFATANEYSGTNGTIRYSVALGAPVTDTNPLPADGCQLNGHDKSGIYADNSGYNACLDDDQIIAETDSVVNANHFVRDLAHIYVMYLPKHVESCFFGGSTNTANNFCTINHEPSSAYCAYHSQAPSSTVYANMPFPVYASAVGFTCSSDAVFPSVQTPNGNADADTEISPSSHEVMEAVTDPDTTTGWFDSSGFENGDECAYVFGTTKGATGAVYNQTINGHHYLTQEEFSNNNFKRTGGGCLQGS